MCLLHHRDRSHIPHHHSHSGEGDLHEAVAQREPVETGSGYQIRPTPGVEVVARRAPRSRVPAATSAAPEVQ